LEGDGKSPRDCAVADESETKIEPLGRHISKLSWLRASWRTARYPRC
jgi:hypothetical protein